MTGRHPPIGPARTSTGRTFPSRRTLLRAAVAGTSAAVAAPLVTACGTAAGQPPGKVALHGDNPSWATPLKAAGEAMRSVDGLELVPEVIPSLESFEQVVKSSLRTSKTPDMLKYWSGYRLQDLARTGGIVDLSDHWASAARKGWVDPALRSAVSYRGRVYGLPMNLAYYVFFYNPEVFRANGLRKPETWDDFLHVAGRLKRAGITPLHGTTAGRWPAFIWFQEILSRQDPQFYEDLLNGRARYTDPRAERALRTIASFFDKDWFTSMDMEHAAAAAGVVHGKVGMLPCGSWLGGTFVGVGGKPGKNVDAFVLPMQNTRVRPAAVFETSALVCTVKGPDRDEAYRAAGAWPHPQVMKAFSHTLQDGCPNPTVTPANTIIDGVATTVRANKARLLNRFWELGPPELVESTVDDLAGFLINPSSYRKVLGTMQDRADEAWKVWKEAEES
ncbi:ABC transporter substrate-binding protein [Streptomyces sp. NBC_01445]|uniref:ABC transporter substrate-binding protein n=3 Tax=unclassified Streptomyces TaxID=2593676 RepID=UPI002DDA590D|nr:extracellular solute-binding protein [Streptomyces sp. NBC_01445]WSE02381.1 extracellular solute-binding protein [Streptomyces sp. NBC_01445]